MARGLEAFFDPGEGLVVQVVALAALVGTGLAVYAGAASLFGAVSPRALVARLIGRQE